MEDAALVLHGEIPSEGVFAEEAGVRFPVDPVAGQKTGFYFDQRENRAAFARLVSARALAGEDVHVADLYCHLGAWGFAALSAGAKHVTFLDSSERALGAVKKILRKMDWEDRATVICGDAKEEIRKLKADSAKSFDLVSLDPPSFIPNRKSAPQGLKAYGSMNSLAGELVKPGGILATSSCSHNCLEERFEAITAEALRKIGRDPRLVLRGWPAYDHPARPGMPESNYLKCLFYAI
jgi:23S rRNA (cytosine1962-C5)-methyltransferase